MKPDFEEFVEEVVRQLNIKFGRNHKIQSKIINKNNGVKYHSVVISASKRNTSPCIPIDKYYELYQKAEDACHIADDIITVYCREKPMEIFTENLTDKDYILKHVLFKIVNTEKNALLFEDTTHYDIPGLNLSMVFYLTVGTNTENEDGNYAYITIQNNHLELSNISEKELVEHAWENTNLITRPNIIRMQDLLSEDTPELHLSNSPFEMYVITSKNGIYGAACILYPEIQKQVSQIFNSDFYVLPSSIHDTIAIPAASFDKCQAEELKAMVMEINRKELSCEEVLSDNVYYYSSKDHSLFLAL